MATYPAWYVLPGDAWDDSWTDAWNTWDRIGHDPWDGAWGVSWGTLVAARIGGDDAPPRRHPDYITRGELYQLELAAQEKRERLEALEKTQAELLVLDVLEAELPDTSKIDAFKRARALAKTKAAIEVTNKALEELREAEVLQVLMMDDQIRRDIVRKIITLWS